MEFICSARGQARGGLNPRCYYGQDRSTTPFGEVIPPPLRKNVAIGTLGPFGLHSAAGGKDTPVMALNPPEAAVGTTFPKSSSKADRSQRLFV